MEGMEVRREGRCQWKEDRNEEESRDKRKSEKYISEKEECKTKL